MKTKLKSSKNNLSITGTGNLLASMKDLGDILSLKLKRDLGIDSKVFLMDCRKSKRLNLSIDFSTSHNSSVIKKIKDLGFNYLLLEKEQCIRVWGFPLSFINSQMDTIREEYKELFTFTTRISTKRGLEFIISVNQEHVDVLNDLKKEIRKSLPCVEVREKGRPRNGDAIPGFLVSLSFEDLRKSILPEGLSHHNEVDGSEDVKEDLRSEETSKSSDLATMAGMISKQKLLELLFEDADTVEFIELVKPYLPEGVGLYNTHKPLVIENGGEKVVVSKF